MNKVLFVTHQSSFASHFLEPQFKLYKDHGYQVDFASSLDDKIDSLTLDNFYDIGIKRSPFKFISNFKAYRRLKSLVKKNNYQVINSHTPVGGVLARFLKLSFPNTQIVYTAHGFHFHQNSSKLSWLLFYPIEKMLSRFTDKQIVLNEEDYRLLDAKKFKSKEKYFVNGVGIDDIDISRTRTKTLDKNQVKLISIGRMDKNKNHRFMIESVGKLVEKYPNVHLTVCGEGQLFEPLQSLIVEKNLENNVALVGYQPDVYQYLKESDIFVSASYREGLPKSVMEALQTGLPCLVSHVRGNSDLVKTGLNGYTFSEFTVDEFVKGFEFIQDNYEQLQKNTIPSVSKFLLTNVIQEYERIYF